MSTQHRIERLLVATVALAAVAFLVSRSDIAETVKGTGDTVTGLFRGAAGR